MPIPKKKKPAVKIRAGAETELVPISSLNLWKNNPRKNDDAVEPLMKILDKHGQRSPIIVWRKNMTIYKGNTTWKAIKKLGWPSILVQYEDFPSEASAVAYGIADNKAGEFSEWDDDILLDLMSTEEMSSLKDATGFDEAELRGLSFEADDSKIDGLTKTDTGIVGTIKIRCRPEDIAEIREVLKGWADDCGFEEVVVK